MTYEGGRFSRQVYVGVLFLFRLLRRGTPIYVFQRYGAMWTTDSGRALKCVTVRFVRQMEVILRSEKGQPSLQAGRR